MKEYLLSALAIVTAVSFVACKKTIEQQAKEQAAIAQTEENSILLYCNWAVYKTTGSSEVTFSHYDLVLNQPNPILDCPGTGEVCMFKVCDWDGDWDIDEVDFNAKVNDLDTDHDGVINDNHNEGSTPDYYERVN